MKTFIVSYEGVVYQKDLGPDTLKIFGEMSLYNPDKSWYPTDDNWPPNTQRFRFRPGKSDWTRAQSILCRVDLKSGTTT